MISLAIVHDHLTCKGGAEQVVIAFHKAFPLSPIYTLAYDSDNTYSYFKKCIIKTSWFQFISKRESIVKKLFFPLGIIAAKQLDVRGYDVVLISSTNCAKYVKIDKNSIIICYAHNPFRLAWYPMEYKLYSESNSFVKGVFNFVLEVIRHIDKKSMGRVNFLIANSNIVKKRLKKVYTTYNGDITVIPPPVSIENFYLLGNKKKYFLVVARLEYYKRIDIVIEVFNKLNYPLIIVGKGSMQSELRDLANSNIEFFTNLGTIELANLYANARAFIFPQLEDFGITPLEANASGLPVICFGEGGVIDSQIPLNETNRRKATAVFFSKQTEDSLHCAILEFEKNEEYFDSHFIRKHAESFSEDYFIDTIKKHVELSIQKSRF